MACSTAFILNLVNVLIFPQSFFIWSFLGVFFFFFIYSQTAYKLHYSFSLLVLEILHTAVHTCVLSFRLTTMPLCLWTKRWLNYPSLSRSTEPREATLLSSSVLSLQLRTECVSSRAMFLWWDVKKLLSFLATICNVDKVCSFLQFILSELRKKKEKKIVETTVVLFPSVDVIFWWPHLLGQRNCVADFLSVCGLQETDNICRA